MSSTLAQRIKQCMEDKKMSNADLARASGVKPPTAFNWASGKTLQIKAKPLHLAAVAFGVTTTWLSTGKGPKHPEYPGGGVIVMEEIPSYNVAPQLDIWTAEAVTIMQALPVEHRLGALANLRTYVHNLGPPEKRPRPANESASGQPVHRENFLLSKI